MYIHIHIHVHVCVCGLHLFPPDSNPKFYNVRPSSLARETQREDEEEGVETGIDEEVCVHNIPTRYIPYNYRFSKTVV